MGVSNNKGTTSSHQISKGEAAATTTTTTVDSAVAKGLPFPEMQPAQDHSKIVWMNNNSNNSNKSDNANSHPVPLSVPGRMNYVTADTKEIHVRRDVAGCDSIYEGATWDTVEVSITNARCFTSSSLSSSINKAKTITLDTNGFQVLDAPLEQFCNNNNNDIDFLDSDSVIDNYYPTCESLLKQLLEHQTKTNKNNNSNNKIATVKAFDHNIRISSNTFGQELKGGGGSKAQVPLGMVHGDYTKTSAPKRLSQLGEPPKANDVLKSRLKNQEQESSLIDPILVQEALAGKRRFALINVWRNIDKHHPVEEYPLACADATTTTTIRSNNGDDDLRILYIHYQDRIGENYFSAYHPSHHWMYYPKMKHSEVMLVKQWDSFGDFARGKQQVQQQQSPNNNNDNDKDSISTFAIHSAFMDPTSPQNAPPRQSIEVRCVVIWEKEEDNNASEQAEKK